MPWKSSTPKLPGTGPFSATSELGHRPEPAAESGKGFELRGWRTEVATLHRCMVSPYIELLFALCTGLGRELAHPVQL